MSESQRTGEVAALRAKIAAIRATLADLEDQVEQLERADADGDINMSEPEETETPKPTLSNEILARVARYLVPRSKRTLLNLASTSKALFQLLIPNLLETLDSDIILDHRFIYYRHAEQQAERVEQYVRQLDLVPTSPPAILGRIPALVNATEQVLAQSCRNLVRLRIDMEGTEDIDAFEGLEFPDLEILELDEAPDALPPKFGRIFPKLRKARIFQALQSYRFSLSIWKDIAALPHLEEISLGINRHHRELSGLPELLAKVRAYVCTCTHCLAVLADVAEFRPSTVIGHIKFNERKEDDETAMPITPPATTTKHAWEVLVKMDSLKHFEGNETCCLTGTGSRQTWKACISASSDSAFTDRILCGSSKQKYPRA